MTYFKARLSTLLKSALCNNAKFKSSNFKYILNHYIVIIFCGVLKKYIWKHK